MTAETLEQSIVFATLAMALALFVWGRWRYDVVAILALLVVAVTGIVPREQVFAGFGNPAVITVAAVLVISRSLLNAGVVDLLSGWVSVLERPTAQVAALTGLVAIMSSFINNVGAIALLIPVAVRLARRGGRSPSFLLMPIAFGSLLGGMTTLIGTPPNLIIAEFRARAGEAPFGMFDFTPVGLGVALLGVAFIALFGWRLLPERKGQASREELFNVEEYLSEVRVAEDSSADGKLLEEVLSESKADVVAVGLSRGNRRQMAPPGFTRLRVGDVLTVEADSESLKTFIDAAGLELAGDEKLGEEELGSDDVSLIEAIVADRSPIEGRTAKRLNLRLRYGVNLLAVARQGHRLKQRLGDIRFRRGDILLLQLPTDSMQDTLSALGCLPLAERALRLTQPRRIVMSLAVFGVGVALAATGVLSAAVAFTGVAAVLLLLGMMSTREVYDSIDWSVIVLLGALIPVGQALETTGGAQLIAQGLLQLAGTLAPVFVLAIVMLVTMLLSDVINNAAAAILMAPIGIGVARGLDASVDPFLMAIAIGASCAFLTPIGHQSNTLVLGPGGYRFGDYWRLGLPLEILVVAVSIPLLMVFWPM